MRIIAYVVNDKQTAPVRPQFRILHHAPIRMVQIVSRRVTGELCMNPLMTDAISRHNYTI